VEIETEKVEGGLEQNERI